MKLRKIIIFISFILLCGAPLSSQKNFLVVTKKELPNQLGAFREIEFTDSQDQTSTIYAAILKQPYHAHLHMHETKIQFFADYLDALSRNHDFTIGINGGYYQPDFTPVGLFIYQGKTIKPLVRNSLLKSCVVINENNNIELETDLTQCVKASNAMQTGPLLIEDGKINNVHLQNLQKKSNSMKEFFSPHKRTLLALSDNNELIMLATSSLSLTDLANFLQHYPNAFGVKKIKTAVNLDGGSSTGMFIRFPGQPFYLHELKHVKTFIFID